MMQLRQLRGWLLRLFGLFQRQQRDQEFAVELESHLALHIADNLRAGMSPEEARRQALIKLGGVTLTQELRREQGGLPVLETLLQDLRFAFRNARKHAWLSVVVVVTLTLGIGISTGVFSWFNAEFLRARVDHNRDSFVKLYSGYTDDPRRTVIPDRTTWQDYVAFRDGAQSFSLLAASSGFITSLEEGAASVTRVALVTENFFALCDVRQPLLGRLLQPEDCTAANPVIVLSERFWRLQLAADPQVLGRVLHVNGQPVTVVGVAPNSAAMGNGARAWLPYSVEGYLKLGNNLQRPGEAAWLNVEGRLRPDVSHAQAAQEIRMLAAQQDRLHPGRISMVVVTDGSPVQNPVSGAQLKSVVALLVGALLVFVLIVCVSVTTLLLARAAARQQEIAVRVALGAGRLRLLRMLLTESLLFAAVAGLASIALAWRMPALLNNWLLTARGDSGGVWYSQAPDWRVFGYLALATMLAGVMAGLTPALQSLKANLSEMLKGRQSLPSGGKGARLYGLLIGTQIALSLFLMAVAVLAVRTARQAIHFAPGFETRQVLAVSQMVSFNRGERPAGTFHRTLTERLSALPGVQSVAWAYWEPLFAGRARMNVELPDRSLRRVAFNTVSANYFATLDIPLVRGRAFREDDPRCETGRCFAIVSQRLAQAFWPDEVPLGKTFQLPQGAAYEVIGVARDISSTTLGGPDEPLFYQLWNPNGNDPANAFVRFAGEEATVTRAVLKAYHEAAPDVPVEAETLQTTREYSLEYIGKVSRLVTFICALAVLLAVISIYGVVAFAVSRRTKELGIRLALGARPANIYRAVFGASGRPVAVGLVVGLALTLAAFSALAPLVRNIPFAVNVWEPLIFVSAVLFLVLAALAAMIGPAHRATKVDPMTALRHE